MKAMSKQAVTWIEAHVAKPLLIAVFFVLVALLWTFLLQHVVAYPFVFLFFGAIMGSAWFGGLVAGLWAILLSSLLIDFFFMPPLYSMTVAHELRTYQEALDRAREAGDGRLEGEVLLSMAETLERLGDPAGAALQRAAAQPLLGWCAPGGPQPAA